MSKLLKEILLFSGGGASKLEHRIDANIFSTYSLCTRPIEELTAQFASTYVLCIAQEEDLTASFASTYSLTVV